MTTTKPVPYEVDGESFEGLWVGDEARGGAQPTVLVYHDWSGRTDPNVGFARRLAAEGWNAIAMDLYGKGRTGETPEQNQALMNPLIGDRGKLRARLLASVQAAAALPEVDSAKVAAIGFCFGGLCVLDLARAGAPLTGVASFHGLFNPPGVPSVTPIRPKVIAFHGWADPMAPPESVVALGEELTRDGADWQLVGFGGALHAFMNEGADMPAMGVKYDAKVAARAWDGLHRFLAEAMG